ncbi:RsmB/NOP family class I SAM-dependent RNA methyltransferase [Tropicibacter oceani]|uniref:RsmB/NOP family class I SAM-dependent RNA methyltransferase n=1 Tax=Tropicibacter oceani TaxID=3058420 RepID=A0ABY8QGR8_9RHOB|nr:RsmB/NOP family class I SAM-dependent RNA methyltransferase [Tropicibacter oceani]WGW02997.1 RsmB/NOP family class I SAM-dependent RNA methyltransferase [Tropicibacter oceani]
MQPAARVQTAIEILDRILAGEAAERALTNWARGARYAGSKDRAAVRDHVFDVLRCQRSCAALGGGESGRALMLGHLRATGLDIGALFIGGSYGPAPLDEGDAPGQAPQGYEAWDMPDWLGEKLSASLGAQAESAAMALRHRADVFLRVNTLAGDLGAAIAALSEDGITAEPHPLSPTALRVTEGARAVARSRAYTQGLVELQDAASQAVVDLLPLQPGLRVLDFCAGGGGKTLAMGARLNGGPVEAHDADPGRMADLPARAARAGVQVIAANAPQGPYDLVLADAPCSGSGAWRRSPEGKWRLTPQALDELVQIQAGILAQCAALVAPDGVLAYATCSMLDEENEAQVRDFVQANPAWQIELTRQFLPDDGGDGFFVACLRRTIAK